MNVPDYVSAIVAYRAWTWGASGLASLNGEPWIAGRPLVAACNTAPRLSSFVYRNFAICHEAPQVGCTCGIYAAKDIDQLRRIGYCGSGIYGEVYLWGTVVEHRLGWRAQFAYPKTLVLSPASLLLQERELRLLLGLYSSKLLPSLLLKNQVKSGLTTLTPYGCDMFIADAAESRTPLWTKRSGYNVAGLNRWNDAASQLTRLLPRVVVLTADQKRGNILRKRVEETHAARVVVQHAGLPTHAADAIVYRMQNQRPRVVIVDLQPKDPRPGICAIKLIRAALGNIAVVAVGDMRNLDNVRWAITAGADEYVDRNNKRNFAEALARALIGFPAQSTLGTDSRGGSTPPGRLPPPPAAVVLSPQNWPRLPPCVAAWAI